MHFQLKRLSAEFKELQELSRNPQQSGIKLISFTEDLREYKGDSHEKYTF